MGRYLKENTNTTVVDFDVVILDQMRKVKSIVMIPKGEEDNITEGTKNYGTRTCVSCLWVFRLSCKKNILE